TGRGEIVRCVCAPARMSGPARDPASAPAGEPGTRGMWCGLTRSRAGMSSWLRGLAEREERRRLAVEALVTGDLRRDMRAVVVGDREARDEDLVLAEAANGERDLGRDGRGHGRGLLDGRAEAVIVGGRAAAAHRRPSDVGLDV